MSGGSTVEHIDAVDAFARTLYLRAKQSGLAFADAASSVRQLHLALRHLRVEAADPDSPLRTGASSSVFARRLRPMVEDCDFTLAQLESVLDRHGDGRPSGDERVRDEKLAVIGSRLMSDKTNVDMFLDTVQLQNPANKPRQVVDNRQPGLEDIKDKVDQIASRLFQNRDFNSFAEDEDSLWLEFKAELEKEGFAPHVLLRHKDILRAYIRELESVGYVSGGTYPTVRGLLEREAKTQPTSPKELPAYDNNEKFYVGMKGERRMPDTAPVAHTLSSSPREMSADSNDSMALISTRDLIAMDSLNSDMAGLILQSPSQQQQYSRSPSDQRYLAFTTAASFSGHELSSSPTSHFGASPRSVPPLPPYVNGGAPPSYGSSPRSRLAPDPYGMEIPADAQWTKIRRTLVSPEILERAGVRYEARPEYVAVLGRLSREQIAEYARQSAEARAARSAGRRPRRSSDRRRRGRDRADSKSSRDDRADSKSSRDDLDDSSAVYDNSSSSDDSDNDTRPDDKGTKSYPYIVHPPTRNKTSPASTVLPKPILKNKNENHVRFDPEPYEVDARSPRSYRDDRDRDRDRDRRRDDRSSRRHTTREGSRRYSDSGERPRERHGDYYGSGRRHHRSDRRGSRREDRSYKKKAWGETLGAVGIGGAAVSLISVLAEAASVV
ncbi:hypothetical protein B0J13DRAFT_43689 [Dactylonectria estremocensis]|uniref:DUF8035 domain-containing protein n=1 Tax=Dactylonectria estremocensis TaxID=1079267 RepID=A0A9P9EU49_9HYPO|nr:hypothetical protein B0J13DRAFT_43689 [Dactylonectria estremocensis]